jgi:hypothetical protein
VTSVRVVEMGGWGYFSLLRQSAWPWGLMDGRGGGDMMGIAWCVLRRRVWVAWRALGLVITLVV